MPRFTRKTGAPHAFSLVELLVVVGIAGILVGVALPALSRAREQTRKAVCAVHLRELFNGVLLYTHDHRGQLPYLGSYYRVERFAHPQVDRAWPGLIGPYIGQVWELYECPSDPRPVAARRVGVNVLRIEERPPPSGGTAEMDAVGQTVRFSYRGEERRRGRLTDPRRPADAVLLIEGLTQPASVVDHFHELVPPRAESRRPGAEKKKPLVDDSFGRHRGESHFLFFTGSVESVRADALDGIQRRHLASGLSWPASAMP